MSIFTFEGSQPMTARRSNCQRRLASVFFAVAILADIPQVFGIAYVTNDVYTVTSYS